MGMMRKQSMVRPDAAVRDDAASRWRGRVRVAGWFSPVLARSQPAATILLYWRTILTAEDFEFVDGRRSKGRSVVAVEREGSALTSGLGPSTTH
jgi:hypothetical protein